MTETKTRSSNNPVKMKLKLEARFTATSKNERLGPCKDSMLHEVVRTS